MHSGAKAELTALSQAVMLLIGGIAVVAMLWLASDGVGGNSQPGALIALFVFCALAALKPRRQSLALSSI